EGGLQQCRSEKRSQGEPARGQHVPFSGLVQAHTPRKSRVFAAVGMEGTGETDWPAEGRGFEPLVPPGESVAFCAEEEGRGKLRWSRDQQFESLFTGESAFPEASSPPSCRSVWRRPRRTSPSPKSSAAAPIAASRRSISAAPAPPMSALPTFPAARRRTVGLHLRTEDRAL